MVWATDAPDWTGRNPRGTLTIAVTEKARSARTERGLRYAIGQMYGVVGTGLIHAQHVFQGLKRDMLVGDDDAADDKKLSVTWAARRDAVFAGDKFNGHLEYLETPANRVFAVYVSPNEMLKEFPEIYGWAEHWTWIAADPSVPLPAGPVGVLHRRRL